MSRDTDDVIDDVKGMVSNSVCSCARVMNFFCYLGFLGQKVIPTIPNCVTFMLGLETEGHVMVYVTFFISACIYPTAMIFMLFREVLGLGINSNYRSSRDHHA